MNHPLVPKRESPIQNFRDSTEYVLLTGATGLVGQFLLKELLMAGVRVAVLVRPSRRLSPQSRIELILQRWERDLGRLLPRPVILPGEVTSQRLGLGDSQFSWVAQNCSAIIHNAAVVSFEEEDLSREPWATNVKGTEYVLSFASDAGIREMHYVSTAFVCGDRQGVITEDELDCGQSFRNAYEESKFRAESLIRAQADKLDVTIYRPSVIAGDSVTGFTSSYHGLMLYLRLLDLLVPQQPRNAMGQHETPIELPMRGDEPHDLVTVDFVGRAISTLFCNPLAHGRTFHLCADQPTTFRDVIDWCCEIYNSGGVVYRGDCEDVTPTSEFSRLFFDQSRVYQSYNRCQTRFEMENLKRFCPGLHSPEIDEAMVRRFIHFGRRDRWGKARPKAPTCPPVSSDRIGAWISSHSGLRRKIAHDPLGIRLLGPGGGDYSATRGSSGEIQVTLGLPREHGELIDLPVAQLIESALHFDGLNNQTPDNLRQFA